MSIPLYYYRNRSGMVAVSYDEGNNIIIPTGRIIELIDAWEEVPEDCRSELNADQLRILESMQKSQRTDAMGHIINSFGRENRDAQRRDVGPDNSYRIRELPESARVVVASFNQKD
jgi:hypothetical protein